MASLLLAAVVQSLHLTGAGGLERGSAVPWPWLTAAPVRAGEAAWGETADSERAQRRLTALVAAACRSLRACVRALRAANTPCMRWMCARTPHPLPVTRPAPACTLAALFEIRRRRFYARSRKQRASGGLAQWSRRRRCSAQGRRRWRSS